MGSITPTSSPVQNNPSSIHTPHPYVGRFAPSPTGPLHMGSLVAALGSFLEARSNNGKWLVRIEDLDPPREQKGASDSILRSLEAHGLEWDDNIIYQSQRHEAYREAIHQLFDKGFLFYCTCSRQQLREHGSIYPGFCRDRKTETSNAAIRCQVDNLEIKFQDLFQGNQVFTKNDEGDFVILRKDGLFAYQLAVTADDAFQNITHVIRGIDLLESTPRQCYLQSKLNFTQPVYGHLPIITNQQGLKLSKQNHSPELQSENCNLNLIQALSYLNQSPPNNLHKESIQNIVQWAIIHWQPTKIINIKRQYETTLQV